MIKLIQGILLVLILIFLSGCSQKEPEVVIQKEYIKEDPFNFVIYDTKGMRIDAKSKEVQRICTPIVLEVGKVYRSFIDGYELQINEYNKLHDHR